LSGNKRSIFFITGITGLLRSARNDDPPVIASGAKQSSNAGNEKMERLFPDNA
jgi:hypothetical protein